MIIIKHLIFFLIIDGLHYPVAIYERPPYPRRRWWVFFFFFFLAIMSGKDGKNNVSKSFKGLLHFLPKISMFCALSQNNQYLLEKLHLHLKVNCLRNSKRALKF